MRCKVICNFKYVSLCIKYVFPLEQNIQKLFNSFPLVAVN